MLNDTSGAPTQRTPPLSLFGRRGLADLLPRLGSALVLMTAALVSVWQGGLTFDVIWACAALAVGFEWQNLIAARRPRIRFFLVGIGLVLCAYFVGRASISIAFMVLGACGFALAFAAGPGRRIWAFSGMAYAGLLVVSVGALHGSSSYGARAIVWLFATVWGTDVFAYFGGRLIGGPKLCPRISPSKTWSGTLAGVFAGALTGAAVGLNGLGAPAAALPLFALGLAGAAVSQGGDMFESSVKRHFGIKDSSTLIPGHGGFMDRLDGFIAAAVFAALVGASRGLPSIAAGLFDWS
ncbi:MAG TPA: phosphatidate cytidylyltransferase [Methylocella sp.]|nr:phosphatidate cytidylyltransferase [Methylocella sp.]